MSHIPIDRQLRSHGLRRAQAGEQGLSVCLSYRGQALAVQAVEHHYEIDQLLVVVLRGFAATHWQRYPEITTEQMINELCGYSDVLGATDAEVTLASRQLELARE